MSMIWVGDRQTVLRFNSRLRDQIGSYCYNFDDLHVRLRSHRTGSPVIGVQLAEVTDTQLGKLERLRLVYPHIRFVIYAGAIESRLIRKNPNPEYFLFLRPGEESDWTSIIQRFLKAAEKEGAFVRQRVFLRQAMNSPVTMEESEFSDGDSRNATSYTGTILDFSKLGMKVLMGKTAVSLAHVRFMRVKYWTQINGRYQQVIVESRLKWVKLEARGTVVGLELIATKS